LIVLLPTFFFFRLADVGSEVWLMVLLTGAVHGVYAWALTNAYQRGDLTLVYPISRSTPAFVPFLAVPFLGERVSVQGGIGIALVMVGVWMVSTGAPRAASVTRSAAGDRVGAGGATPGTRLRVWNALSRPELRFAYLTLAATVGYSLIDKRAMDLLDRSAWHGPAPRAVVYYALLCIAYLPFFYLLSYRRLALASLQSTARERPFAVLGVVVASFVSYTLILQAMRTAPVSYVVATRQLSVVFAVSLAMLWLRERPSRARVLGAALTVLGVATIGLAGGG
jgi:drug/metabolite transporter (DMT)-like permease